MEDRRVDWSLFVGSIGNSTTRSKKGDIILRCKVRPGPEDVAIYELTSSTLSQEMNQFQRRLSRREGLIHIKKSMQRQSVLTTRLTPTRWRDAVDDRDLDASRHSARCVASMPTWRNTVRTTQLEIPDVLLIAPKRFDDRRGFFTELYSARGLEEAGIRDAFVQDNLSRSSKAGMIRGPAFPDPTAFASEACSRRPWPNI